MSGGLRLVNFQSPVGSRSPSCMWLVVGRLSRVRQLLREPQSAGRSGSVPARQRSVGFGPHRGERLRAAGRPAQPDVSVRPGVASTPMARPLYDEAPSFAFEFPSNLPRLGCRAHAPSSGLLAAASGGVTEGLRGGSGGPADSSRPTPPQGSPGAVRGGVSGNRSLWRFRRSARSQARSPGRSPFTGKSAR